MIFDTNVLLEHLDVVDSWWKALQGAGAEHTALLMPMVRAGGGVMGGWGGRVDVGGACGAGVGVWVGG